MNTYQPILMSPKAEIESWDDDQDLEGFEGLHLRHASATTAFSQGATRSPRHRESISSRVSNRSADDDSEWQLPLDDPIHAIKHARNAGVPIPANIPASALLGGTIRKLGTKKKASKDNYDDDIELPTESGERLTLNTGKAVEYPTSLRNLSSGLSPAPKFDTSPETPTKTKMSFQQHLDAMGQGMGHAALDRFRENADEDDVFADIPTIKVGKTRSPLKTAGFYAVPQGLNEGAEADIMDGLELGNSESPLKLSKRKASPATPAHLMPADLVIEGLDSHGSGFIYPSRGNRPSGRSDRSSSITAHSPSVFSPALSGSFTAESEDEGLDGLVLPDGPVNFGEALKRRLETMTPENDNPAKRPEMVAPPKDDFFDDLDIDDGKVFDARKLASNRNVKYAVAKSSSPSRRGGTAIVFTNKSGSATTRIPKPAPIERPKSKMETISENAPTPQPRRAASRMITHSPHVSVTGLPTPTTPTFVPPSVPSTPTRRGLGNRSSTQSMRPEPTTTSAQLLKAKRSMPHLRSQGQPPRPQSMYARPPSRTDRNQKANTTRPKTPVERLGGAKTPGPPFLPAGGSAVQTHHVSSRHSRHGRPASGDLSDLSASVNRPLSRLSNAQHRPRTPNSRNDVAPEALTRQAAAKKTLTRPTRRRAYGDGSELDGFDDLVTSRDQETKHVRQPREVQSTYMLRSMNRQSGDLRKHFSTANLAATPSASTSGQIGPTRSHTATPQRPDSKVPSFARDTAASRLAREQRVSRNTPQHRNNHISEGNLHARFKDQLSVKPVPSTSPRTLRRTKKPSQPLNLIRQLGGEVKPEKGMHYNAVTSTWEGNENALAIFDSAPVDRKMSSTPNAGSSASPSRRNNTTPKPALIAPVGQSKQVITNGAMVFDPVQMKWLKMGHKLHSRPRNDISASVSSITSGPAIGSARSVTTVTEDDDDDPFAGIPDMDDERQVEAGAGGRKSQRSELLDSDDDSNDEAPRMIEDFDVGPEFVREQKKQVARALKRIQTKWKWPDSHFERPSVEQQLEESHRLMARIWAA